MKRILPLIIISVVTATFFLAVGSSWANGDDPEGKSFQQAYVVKEIAANGDILNIYKGVSDFSTEREIAVDLGLNPSKEDRFSSVPKIEMGYGSVIKLYRAPRYTVIDGNKTLKLRSWQDNVGDLLKEKNIILGKDDKINFDMSFQLEPEMEIKIIRVAKTEVVENEPIDYKTIKKEDPNLERGKTRIEQYGEKGTRKLTYEVVRENGKEISKKMIKNDLIKEPINKIIIVGTKVIVLDSGWATWYVRSDDLVAAHNSIKAGSYVRVVNLDNGKAVDVRVVGRGIKHSNPNVVIDLSTGAFRALGGDIYLDGILKNIKVEKIY